MQTKFLMYDEFLDVRPYGLMLDEKRECYYYHYDSSILKPMFDTFKEWKERPAACSMDICFTKDGRTLLVELNDAYSLGCYGLPNIAYAKFISARRSELLEHEDDYRF